MKNGKIVKCHKCGGSGNVGSWRTGNEPGEAYYTIDNGVCWECGGKGTIDKNAVATKEDMQEIFATIQMQHVVLRRTVTATTIKHMHKRRTRPLIKNALEQMARMGLVKLEKQGRRTIVKPTKFGLERWEAHRAKILKENPLKLI